MISIVELVWWLYCPKSVSLNTLYSSKLQCVQIVYLCIRAQGLHSWEGLSATVVLVTRTESRETVSAHSVAPRTSGKEENIGEETDFERERVSKRSRGTELGQGAWDLLGKGRLGLFAFILKKLESMP